MFKYCRIFQYGQILNKILYLQGGGGGSRNFPNKEMTLYTCSENTNGTLLGRLFQYVYIYQAFKIVPLYPATKLIRQDEFPNGNLKCNLKSHSVSQNLTEVVIYHVNFTND